MKNSTSLFRYVSELFEFTTTDSGGKRHRNAALKLMVLFIIPLLSFSAKAQFVVQYPTAVQNLTACLNNSLLTVRIDVTALTTNSNQVTLKLAPGIQYVPGSVTKTGGAGTNTVTIAEANISNLNQPVFDLSPTTLAVGDYIIFTIRREAMCSAYTEALVPGTVFKDGVTVTGTAGTTTENDISINPYNVNYPSYSIAQPAAVNNTILGGTYTRNFTITNGAQGSANAVRFYIVYPSAGIEFVGLTLNSLPVTPTSTNGDTTFFNLTGTQLGSDQLMTNGESLVLTEQFKVKKCGTTTTYNAGWGCGSTPAGWCQTVSGTGSITMASGTPNFTGFTSQKIGFVDACTPFVTRYTFTNGGSGNAIAAGMYNVKLRLGRSSGGALYAGRWDFISLLSGKIGSVSGITITGGTSINAFAVIELNDLPSLFGVDPDGAGVGLDDLDSDGYYDDLAGGKTITLEANTSVNCSLFTCNQDWSTVYLYGADMQFTGMCSASIQGSNTLQNNGAGFTDHTVQLADKSYCPANVFDGVPFRARFSVGYYSIGNPFDNANTRYVYEITLPAGISVSAGGNPNWFGGQYPNNAALGGATISFTQVGNVVTITSPNSSMGWLEIDLVYTCGVGGSIDIPYKLRRLDNIVTNCVCNDLLFCDNATIANVICPGPCPDGGPSLTFAKVERDDNSLGWTDATLTTNQSRAAISDYDLSKALYLDDFTLTANAVQNTIASTNLFVKFSIKKLIPYAGDIITPINIDVTIIRGGSTVSSGTGTTWSGSASTTTIQEINWDISSLLPSGGLLPGDIIETKSHYSVSANNFNDYDIQTGDNLYIYNKGNLNQELYCNRLVPEMYLVSPYVTDAQNGPAFQSCNTMSIGSATHNIAYRFGAAGTKFLYEVRPGMLVKKLTFTIPENYNLVSVSWFGGDAPFATETLTPVLVSGRTYEIDLPEKTLDITVTNAYALFFNVYLKPTCAVTATGPVYKSKVDYIPYYYHYKDLAVKPTASISKTLPANYLMGTKPAVELSDLTGQIQAYHPQHSWTVKMTSTGTTTAPYTWLAIPTSTAATIAQVVDVASGTPLTPITYAGGKWYKISSTGLASGLSKEYRIDFSYVSCQLDSIKVLGGWNCSDFPTDPDAYVCSSQQLWLKFVPVATEVEVFQVAAPTSPVPMCDPISYQYSVQSSQAGNILNNKFIIHGASGIKPISGSVKARYPNNATGTWTVLPAPTVVGNSYSYDLTAFAGYPTATGLPGTLAGVSNEERQIGLIFDMETDCDFISGSGFNVSTSAKSSCGSITQGSDILVATPTLFIQGVSSPYVTVHDLNSSAELVSCANSTVVSATTTTAVGVTGNDDFIFADLPDGLRYVAGSITCSSTNCPSFVSTSILTGNIQRVTLKIPSGLPSGTTLNYSITVEGMPTASCGDYIVNFNAVVRYGGIACSTAPGGICPAVFVSTGSNTVIVKVKKPVVKITTTSTKTCTYNGNTELKVVFEAKNTSSIAQIAGQETVIDFYCGDGSGNISGSKIYTHTMNNLLPAMSTVTDSVLIPSSACGAGGQLISVVSQLNNCVCANDTSRLTIGTYTICAWRSITSGTWEDVAIWEGLDCATNKWIKTCTPPNNDRPTYIFHTVDIPVGDTIVSDSLRIETTGRLEVCGHLEIGNEVIFKVDENGKAGQIINNCGTSTCTVNVRSTATAIVRKNFSTVSGTYPWNFVSVPFDVTEDRIFIANTNTQAVWGDFNSPTGDFYIGEYDGQKRANDGFTNGSNYVNLPAHTLVANKGYVLAAGDANNSIDFRSIPGTQFACNDTQITTTYYAGVRGECDHGWNLIGVPFVSGYNLKNAAGNKPYYVFDGTNYTTVMAGVDHLIYPFSAFFLQNLGDADGVNFLTANQTFKAVKAANTADLISLVISNGRVQDKTHIRLMDYGSVNFLRSEDGGKLMSPVLTTPQIYTVAPGACGEVAYNTLPLNTTRVDLKVRTGKQDTYTISMMDKEKATGITKVILVDTETGIQTNLFEQSYSYDIDINSSTISSRFYILLTSEVVTGYNYLGNENVKIRTNGKKVTLTGLNGKATVHMYDAIGKLIYQYANVSNDNSFDVNIPGMYIMNISTETQQVRVKIIVNKN